MGTPVQERPRPGLPSRAPLETPSREWAAVVVPALLAALLSFYRITGRSLGFDEGATVAIASQHGSALWSALAHDGGNMSGYYLLIHVLIGTFGHGLLVLRVVSALSIVATVGLIAAIGRRLFDWRVALAGGVLAAVSLPLVYWGQTARGYAPMTAFVCAGYLAFIELAAPGAAPRASGRPARGAWVGYVAAMTLAMYCSFVAVLVIPAQLLVVTRRRDAWRRIGSALGVLAVAGVPLAVLAVRRGSGQLFWVTRPSKMVDSQVLQSLTSGGLSPSFHLTATTHLLMWVTVGAVVALTAELAWRGSRTPTGWGAALILAWAVLPAALTFVYSLVSQPIFVPRNVLMSTPAVSLALATAIRGRSRLAAVIPLLALTAVVALRALQVAASYGVSPEPWNTVTARVLERARPGDCIAFFPEDGRMAFQYYAGAGRQTPRSVLPALPWGTVKPYVEDYASLTPAQIARRTTGCTRLWFISSHEGQANGPARARAHRTEFFRLGADLQRRFGPAPVKSYGYASTIHVQLLTGPRHSPSR